ncbi:glycosyltransferase [Haloarchaeobius sp. HRN-SO-5]|uniref:glycosyltransferase n=1 Tax=Haloarchaeobius sp. HRN-SO-5 TaxID=3446118 RepID=UPI003EB9EB78
MRVLNLVTTPEATFYQHQTRALEAAGIETETVAVGREPAAGESRSPLAYARLVPTTLRRSLDDFDLVHANNGLTAPAALLQQCLPVVVSLWGTDLMGKYGRFTRFFANRADAVIVMTDEMAARLDREAHVIPHAVDLDTFRPIPSADARTELGWDHDSYQVLFPYPKERRVKNYPRARRVVDAASERVDRPVELQTVFGVDHDRMPLYYGAADLLLLTSHREGSPNAVKEALACDTPVVSVDVGDVDRRVADAALSRVCQSDPELVEGVVDVLTGADHEPGSERGAVTDLGTETMATRIRAVYDEVLD